MSQSTPVRISELKAHLSEHLRDVRRGGRVTIYDRDTPIAELTALGAPPSHAGEPVGGLTITRATTRLRDVVLPSPSASMANLDAAFDDERSDRT